MNRFKISYPRGNRVYIDIFGNVETMTVQDVLDQINKDQYLESNGSKTALFHRYFNLGKAYKNNSYKDKCKQFLELYRGREEAINSENPIPRDMLIRDIPGINIIDTRNQIWFNLDRDTCYSYIADLQMAQKRRSFAVASILPQNVQTNIFDQLNLDLVGEVGSKMKSNRKTGFNKSNKSLKILDDIQDYNMNQTYDEFLEERENNGMSSYVHEIDQYGGNSDRDLQKDLRKCRKINKTQEKIINKITRLYEEKILEDMDRIRVQEYMENHGIAEYIEDINQYGGMFDDLPIDVINRKLQNMNCRDRLSYCQTNRKSMDHCNSEPTSREYIKPCRNKSKMNKTKQRAIEVSRRLQKKNLLERQLKSKQEEIRRREVIEIELLEKIRQHRDIDIPNDDMFEDTDDELY